MQSCAVFGHAQPQADRHRERAASHANERLEGPLQQHIGAIHGTPGTALFRPSHTRQRRASQGMATISSPSYHPSRSTVTCQSITKRAPGLRDVRSQQLPNAALLRTREHARTPEAVQHIASCALRETASRQLNSLSIRNVLNLRRESVLVCQ